MNKILLAVGFFIADAASGSIFAGIQATAPQQAPAPKPRTPDISGVDQAFKIGNVIPVVPPIVGHIVGEYINSRTQPLDGLECIDCIFEDTQLTYGGGSVILSNLKMSGNTTITYTGAAYNGLQMEAFMNSLKHARPLPSPPKPAMEQLQLAKAVTNLNFSSPFIGKK